MYQNTETFGKNSTKVSISKKLREPKKDVYDSLKYNPSYNLVKPRATGAVMNHEQMVLVDVGKYI